MVKGPVTLGDEEGEVLTEKTTDRTASEIGWVEGAKNLPVT